MTDTLVHSLVLPWLNALVLALVPVFGGLALALLRKHGIDTAWFEAIGRAGGASYSSLLASGKPVTDRGALVAAAQVGADYLVDRVPAIVASKGLAPDALAQIAGAELGKVLGLDPTQGPGVATVTATAGVGQTATASVAPEPPATLTETPIVRTLGLVALLAAGLSLSACTSAQEARTLAAAQQVCAAHAVIVAVEPVLVAAHPGIAAQADAACAVVAAVKQ